MARCRQCGAEIPEGLEYCDQCADKLNTAKASESYLDSLLNAVMTEKPERREIAFQKREVSSPVSVPVKDTVKPEKEENAREELPDLASYSIFDETEEMDVDRMLEKDLREAESGLLEQEASAEPASGELFSMEEEQEASAELFDFFADAVTMEDMTSVDEEIPEVPDNGEPEESMGAAEAETVAETAEELEDFTDLFSEEALVEQQADVNLDALLSGLDGLTESRTMAEEAVEEPVEEAVTSDFSDLFADFGEDGLFEFGAEPEEFTDLTDEGESAAMAAKPESASEGLPENKAEEISEKDKKKQNAISALFHKLFDNVKVDPSKIKPQPTKEEIEAKKQAAKEAKEKSKEEKEALLAEKKEQEQQIKAEKRRLVLEAKAEKKARKLEEAKLLLEEMESTRINRAGASIVFIFFAMIAVVIVVGTSIFSYSLSIRNAQYEFDRDEYTLAYNEIFGLDIKDEDIVLYDRIMTVMFVQKQLNSYYNYYEMKDYTKALDSLLKGLRRYEKYIELAVELDIESDLDSVRSSILMELDASFYMSEQEAMHIIQSDSQLEYSVSVYDAVDKMKQSIDTKAE